MIAQDQDQKEYATYVAKLPYGSGLFASRDLEAGTPVQKFEGPIVEYNDLSDYDKTYVLNFQPKGSEEWKWLLPTSNARYANHSCDPNTYINAPTLELVTRRPLKANEQITFVYNNGDEVNDWYRKFEG
ncbi:hypothetical protein HK097_002320 [Rhizophlyctis rosea]|uniref:SET domain-containing protein n=1 Tax=Rhizophlyctis rosea TaxID=64517 RepID=A0AAD5SMR5_9FUNG|nr:hypothetical protein HK097_002320 [Rhizophlyctis rosea]